MSSNIDKRKLDTLEQSDSRHQKGTLSSGYRTSSQKSTISQFSMRNVFQISVQYLMPLIMKIKEENHQLNEVKGKMSDEMTILQQLSVALVQENQELRAHYQTRTEDVKKVTQTMTINTNQNYSDTKHLIQTFRNRNGSMIRNIQILMDENKEITKSLTNEKQSLKRIQEDNIKAEEMMRERAAKAKQAKIKKEEVEKKREYKFQKNTVNLETEIDELTLEINGKRKKNIQFLRAIQKNGSELSVEKPHKIRQNVEIIKALKLMNTQVHQIKQKIQKEKNLIDELSSKKQRTQIEFKGLETMVQKKKHKLQFLNDKVKNSKEQQKKMKEKIKITESEKQKYDYELNKLEKETKAKKNAIEDKKQKHKNKKIEIEKQKQKAIYKIKQQIQNKESLMHTNTLQHKKEYKEQEDNLKYVKSHYNSLVEETEELQRKIQSMNNPVKDILRLQYKLKQKKIC